MCRALSKIKGKTTDEILKEFEQNDSVPVDLEQLLKSIGISALPFDFSTIEKNNNLNHGDILGSAIVDEDNALILYSKDSSLNRQRFTIAHELAHCCLDTVTDDKPHVEFRYSDDFETDEHEELANIFAGALLIPLKKLYDVYINLSFPTSTALAREFAVSVNVMEARLNHLKISYYDRNGQAVVYGNE